MKKNNKHIVIIGAGEVGVTLTIIMSELAKIGLLPGNFSITLVEKEDDILAGATHVANVNHESGYEYLKRGHVQTGIDCIHGGLTKRLFFDMSPLETRIENRFLISTDTIEKKIAVYEDFEQNVKYMKSVYERSFNYIADGRGWDKNEATDFLQNDPGRFGVKLDKSDVPEVKHVVGGYQSAGGSIKMAYGYAVKKSILNNCLQQNTELILNEEVRSIEKYGAGYKLRTTTSELTADMVVICAAHHNPCISSIVQDALPAPAGMYHLNSMLYLKLDPCADREILRLVSRVNFILQGEGGCMYACCLKPTETNAGYAAVYYPSEKGNQIEKHFYDPANPVSPPEYWDEWIRNGLPGSIKQRRLENIFERLFRFNPFLEGNVNELNFLLRTVFNPVVNDNENGTDRRVRELIGVRPVTKDGRVLTATSPKWTNVELSALSVIEKIVNKLWETSLPKHPDGLGPEKIDVEFITRKANFHGADFSKNFVLHYQRKLNLPTFSENLQAEQLLVN